jgi:hypothetical protein
VAVAVVVIVAGPVIVAVHVHGNAPVVVIEKVQKVARDAVQADRWFLLGVQQDLASIPDDLWRIEALIPKPDADQAYRPLTLLDRAHGGVPVHVHGQDHGSGHGHDDDHDDDHGV